MLKSVQLQDSEDEEIRMDYLKIAITNFPLTTIILWFLGYNESGWYLIVELKDESEALMLGPFHNRHNALDNYFSNGKYFDSKMLNSKIEFYLVPPLTGNFKARD